MKGQYRVNKGSEVRVLKIQETGDFYKQETKIKITLQGKWLEQMGFKANDLVSIKMMTQGEIVIKRINNVEV